MEDDFDELMVIGEEGQISEGGKRWLEKNESRIREFKDNNFVMSNKNNMILPEIKIVEKIVLKTELKKTGNI